jgi:CubicO group peptidase (beta-lactamase class C family)
MKRLASRRITFLLLTMVMSLCSTRSVGAMTFPGEKWEMRDPAEMGLDPNTLDRIAEMLGSSGCIVKDGYLVKTWGSIDKRHDWYSSAKPIFSTLLLFAIREGRVSSVDEKISKWGWPLEGKDRGITFRHLANMTSGYMQPEGPGEAFAHNDFAVALMIRTLEKVFDQPIGEAARQHIYEPLGMQDAPYHQVEPKGWKTHGRAWISVRDWARLSWFWMNKGNWNGVQLLPRSYFDQYMKVQVPANLPYSRGPNIFGKLPADPLPEDYLSVRSFGGGSNHYQYGAGIYGFHWYFNAPGTVGTLYPDDPSAGRSFQRIWPDLPSDMMMTVGWGINTVMIPSLGLVQVCAENANWGHPYLTPDDPDFLNYRIVRLLVESSTAR